jgi:hypothetical protein
MSEQGSKENPVMRIDGIVESLAGMLVELSADVGKVSDFLLPRIPSVCKETAEKPMTIGWFSTHYQKLDELRDRLEKITGRVKELSNILS